MSKKLTRDNSRKEKHLFGEYRRAYYEDNNLALALEKLEELLEITNIKQFVSYLIVDIYTQMGKPAKEAYEVANRGIQYQYPFSGLYKQYAELILVIGSGDKKDLETALSSINEAIRLYNQESIDEYVDDSVVRNADSLKYWFDNKTKTRMEMANLQSDIKSLIYSRTVYDNVQHIQSKIEKDVKQIKSEMVQEKQRTLELMALFTAIIALILSNVQVLSRENEWWHILIVNGSLLFVLTWIIFLVSKIGRKNK